MKSKISLFLCVAAIISGVMAYGTYANYVASIKTTNIITTNEVKIQLIEKACTDSGLMKEFDNKIIHNTRPGDSYSKIPYVKNVGSEPCYVRIYIEANYEDDLSYDINENWIKEDANSNTQNGWYRYNKVLDVGKMTEPIFTTVTFSITMGNEFVDEEITVDLKADAVQSEHNDEFLNYGKESEG